MIDSPPDEMIATKLSISQIDPDIGELNDESDDTPDSHDSDEDDDDNDNDNGFDNNCSSTNSFEVHTAKLRNAVLLGDLDTVRSIFEELGGSPWYCLHSALINTSDPRTEETLLMIACQQNDLSMVRYLIEKGKSTDGGNPKSKLNPQLQQQHGFFFVNTVDNKLGTALHRAVIVRNDDMINLLLDNEAIVDTFFERYLINQHLQYLNQSTNTRLREEYEEMFGKMIGWPVSGNKSVPYTQHNLFEQPLPGASPWAFPKG
jgi:ankyrin repeat protein